MEFKLTTPVFFKRKQVLKLIMRTFIFLFCTSVFSFSPIDLISQNSKIVIKSDKTLTIDEVFDMIDKQTDYSFVYKSDMFKGFSNIEIKKGAIKTNKLLEQILSTGNYDVVVRPNNTIIIKTKIPDLIKEQGIQVSGTVTDLNGEVLPGSNIIEKGTTNGTQSNFDGKFNLTVTNENAILVVSYLGFSTKEVLLNNQSELTIILIEDAAKLDEIVLVGYGSQKRKDITSAISTIDLEGTSDKSNTDVGQLLAARSAGVRVVQGSGKPGAGPTVFVRGVASLSGNTQPLYVIDGVVTYGTAAIDPNNIESISVLKDASAAGIYGAAGASNGVVLITTKKGKYGKPKVEINSYTGFSEVIKTLPVLNNTQLRDYFNDLDGSGSGLTDAILSTNNDWQDLIYRNSAPITGVNASFSGGSEKGSYFVGLGYLDQEGIIITSEHKRYSLAINLDHKIKEWLSFGTHFNYTRSKVKDIPDNKGARYGGSVLSALVTPPFQEIYNADGTYSTEAFIGGLNNPLGYIYGNDNLNVINNIVADANMTIKLPANLTYKTQIGITLGNNHYEAFQDPRITTSAKAKGGVGALNTGESLRYIFDNTLSYKNTFDKHQLGFIIGTSVSEENSYGSGQSKSNFASPLIRTLNSASVNEGNSAGKGSWALQSYFARANYSYDDKYLLTGSIRTDGSSRLPVKNRWENFRALSAGWKISNENFMKNVDVLSGLKLRAGFGETGNLPSSLHPYISTVQFIESTLDGVTLIPGIKPSEQAGNNDLEWETSEQFNLGLDVSFLNDRISLTADYYTKKTKNLIYTLPLPISSGQAIKTVNLDGIIENKGFEFAIDANLFNGEDFNWNASYNMSFNTNIVKGIPESSTIFTNELQNLGGKVSVTKNGLPLGSFWGYISEGVDPQTGDLIFTDTDGVSGITPEDKTSIGSPLPDFTYGFVNELSYKNIYLNIVIDGVSGSEIYNVGKQTLERMGLPHNQSTSILNRWQNPGDITNIPRASVSDPNGNAGISSRFIEDGSYLRVRDISFGYSLGKEALEKVNLGSVRFYVNLKNWFTITDYSGYSPEVNAGGASALTQGLDYGTYPQAKTFTFGINVEL